MSSHKQKRGKGKILPSWEVCLWSSPSESGLWMFPKGTGELSGAFPWKTFSSGASLPVYPSKLSMLLSLAHFSCAPKGCSTGLVCRRSLLLSQHWLLPPEPHCWIMCGKWKAQTEVSWLLPTWGVPQSLSGSCPDFYNLLFFPGCWHFSQN